MCEILELAVGVAVDKHVLHGLMSIIQLCAEVSTYCKLCCCFHIMKYTILAQKYALGPQSLGVCEVSDT